MQNFPSHVYLETTTNERRHLELDPDGNILKFIQLFNNFKALPQARNSESKLPHPGEHLTIDWIKVWITSDDQRF